MPDTISGRALATALGVNEKAVRKAVESGRIERAANGRFDLAACRQAWDKNTDPARSKVRTARKVRTSRSAPLPEADAAVLWHILADVVTSLPWSVVAEGGGLQLAFDVHADFVLNLTGILRIRQLAEPPVFLDQVDWRGLAQEYGVPFIEPQLMAADWQRRRDAD